MSTPETPGDRIEEFAVEEPAIRPYETRALNYLINEYLLLSDYKLTSVTFAEENENQVCTESEPCYSLIGLYGN